jgi:biotin carboxyl carrier protein
VKKLNVTVNGITFEVEVELIEEGDTQEVSTFPVPNTSVYQQPSPMATASPEVTRPQLIAEPSPKFNKPQPVGTKGLDDSALYSPMNGKIMDVKVKIGQFVKSGQVVIEMEAMKMKTNIYSNRDGSIKTILVTTGSLVESGQKLLEFE